MKPKNSLQPRLAQTACYSTLGLLLVTSTSEFAFAQIRNPGTTKQHTQEQLLAQFSDGNSGQQERSQLIRTANTLFSQGDLAGAEDNLRKFIKKYPKDAFGYYQLGNVLFRQERKDEAIKQYQEAIRLDSKYALAHNGIGLVFASQEQWEAAIAEYNKALAINPNYGDALTNLAQALWEVGKREEAIASLEKALSAFKAQNKPRQVERIQEILRQLKPNDDPSVS
ncbi:tetratricopeptide repeat protein [Fischerella sp. JS2]|uniref:tetratricopeptide repeat protein n=1 Tax=Fischerella sp. JS2 TaxID=2597771 RepID=UPI0028E58443|nr:tetratricopeptide repeat protein [Fischerella sp. JS2]